MAMVAYIQAPVDSANAIWNSAPTKK